MNRNVPKLLDKARENVQIASKLIEDGHIAVAVSRAYYALFYAAEALLASRGMSFTKHSAVIAAFGQHFAKTKQIDAKFHRYLIEAFQLRGRADYTTDFTCTPSRAQEIVGWADEFITAAAALLEAT